MAKCPNCGSENPDSFRLCVSCGQELIESDLSSDTEYPMEQESSSELKKDSESMTKEVLHRMKHDYLHAPRDSNEKIVESMSSVLSHYQEPGGTLRNALEETAKVINRIMRIREASIGMKNPIDGLFRHEVYVGFRKDVEALHKNISYTYNDFFDPEKYRGTSISDFTLIYLAEEQPHTREVDLTFNRPVLLGKERRRSPDESLEGDYFEIHIYGRNKELIGWIEISGTKSGKIPDINTIKWIEFIASILGVIIEKEMIKRKRIP